jgi:signal recognition particle receptor subunit beta
MFILTVDTNGKVGQEKIDRLIRIHETPQDPVVVVYTNTKLPDGYTVDKFDGLVKHLVKSDPKFAEDINVKKAVREQNERLSKEKFFNK